MEKLRNISDLVGKDESDSVDENTPKNASKTKMMDKMIKSAKKTKMTILQKETENQISNPNSPIENEKIMNEIENQKNQGRIDLEIQTPDDKKAAENTPYSGEVFGPNYRKN